MVGLACGADDLLGSLVAHCIVGYHLEFAGFVAHIHPAQTITVETILSVWRLGIGKHRGAAPRHRFRNTVTEIGLKADIILPDTALALAIDEEFCFGIVGVAEDGCHFALTSRPCPMGQQVQSLLFGCPVYAIEVGAILGKTRKVKNAEITAA